MPSFETFSDFLWKLLIITSLSSAIIFGVFLLLQSFLRKISGRLYNRVAQISLATVLGTLLLSTVLLLSVDQDIQEKCFGSFASAQGSFGVTRILALVWLAGVGAFAAIDFIQVMRFKGALNGAILSDEAEFTRVKSTIAPSSFGLLRPRILLPEQVADDMTLKQYVLSHEKTHLRNYDGLWTGMALVVTRLCWFNPMVIFFEQGRRLAMEMATDEEVIRRHSFTPAAYAAAMLQVLELSSNQQTHRLAVGAALGFNEMKFRLENLKALSTEKPKALRVAVLAVMCVGWLFGVGEAFASMNLSAESSRETNMCYQVQHEKIIERVLNIEPRTNKCE